MDEIIARRPRKLTAYSPVDVYVTPVTFPARVGLTIEPAEGLKMAVPITPPLPPPGCQETPSAAPLSAVSTSPSVPTGMRSPAVSYP